MIQTARLVLQLGRPADIPAIVRYYQENAEHLQPWEPAWPPDFLAEAYWPARIEHAHREDAAGLAHRLFVRPREEPRRIIGTLSLTQVQRGAAQTCTIGYGLAAAAQGHGYMREAVEAATLHCFHNLGLHRVTASYMPRNRRSAAVLHHCGFRIEGYARDYLQINGRWEDHILTARLSGT